MTCRAQVCFLLLDQLRLILFWRSKKKREREINPQSNRAETGRKKPRSSQSRFTGRRTPISIWRRRSERLWWGDWSGLVAAHVSSTASTVRAVCSHVTYFVASSPLQRCSAATAGVNVTHWHTFNNQSVRKQLAKPTPRPRNKKESWKLLLSGSCWISSGSAVADGSLSVRCPCTQGKGFFFLLCWLVSFFWCQNLLRKKRAGT